MFEKIIEGYLSSRSPEQLIDMLGGPERVAEILIKGFEMCGPKEQKKLRKTFLGKQFWGKLNLDKNLV